MPGQLSIARKPVSSRNGETESKESQPASDSRGETKPNQNDLRDSPICTIGCSCSKHDSRLKPRLVEILRSLNHSFNKNDDRTVKAPKSSTSRASTSEVGGGIENDVECLLQREEKYASNFTPFSPNVDS